MKVPHLNEFLKRAIKQGILDQILVDFSTSKSGFCNDQVVKVRVRSLNHVTLVASSGTQWNWGLGSDSLEILDIKKSFSVNSKKIILCLGRKCDFQGVLK